MQKCALIAEITTKLTLTTVYIICRYAYDHLNYFHDYYRNHQQYNYNKYTINCHDFISW